MEQRQYGPIHVTAGERFAEAGNDLIKGIQEIQKLVNSGLALSKNDDEELLTSLIRRYQMIAPICERLIGPYKLVVADLSQVDEFPTK